MTALIKRRPRATPLRYVVETTDDHQWPYWSAVASFHNRTVAHTAKIVQARQQPSRLWRVRDAKTDREIIIH